MVLTACRTREQLPKDFVNLYASSTIRTAQDLFKFVNLAIEYTTKEEQRVYNYVVQHAMMASSGNEEMDKWARERKLFPWVAIAAPLIVSHHRAQKFSVLCIQCRRVLQPSSHSFGYSMSDIVSG